LQDFFIGGGLKVIKKLLGARLIIFLYVYVF
jgi:hypothetical protein